MGILCTTFACCSALTFDLGNGEAGRSIGPVERDLVAQLLGCIETTISQTASDLDICVSLI